MFTFAALGDGASLSGLRHLNCALAKRLAAFIDRMGAELDERVQRELLHVSSLDQARPDGEISESAGQPPMLRSMSKWSAPARAVVYPVAVNLLRLVCCWVGLLTALACGAVQRPDGGTGLLGVGARVTPLRGEDQHGRIVVLSFPAANPTVVYFYPKDSTPGCTREACAFRDVWRKYQARQISVIGVSSDDVASHASFAEEHELPFPLIADEGGEWARAFGVPSVAGFHSRVTFLVGRDGRVLKTYESVDPGLHAQQILDDAAMFGQAAATPTSASNPAENEALLAPAPRLASPSAPSVDLKLHFGVSPDSEQPTGMWLAAELTPPPGAHLSWKHASESGLPTSVEFFGPAGFDVGATEYPAPLRFRTDTGRQALGYTGSFVVLARVQPSATTALPEANRPDTHVTFQVHGTWLSCDVRCTKEEVQKSLRWEGKPATLPLLPKWFASLPSRKPPAGFGAKFVERANTIELASAASWQIEDAFVERDVATGGLLPAFTRSEPNQVGLSLVLPPAPRTVVVQARSSDARTQHFIVDVTQ